MQKLFFLQCHHFISGMDHKVSILLFKLFIYNLYITNSRRLRVTQDGIWFLFLTNFLYINLLDLRIQPFTLQDPRINIHFCFLRFEYFLSINIRVFRKSLIRYSFFPGIFEKLKLYNSNCTEKARTRG